MRPPLPSAVLPDDAVEVARILGAWGVKGWFKIQPHSASAEALFSCDQWWLLPPEPRKAQRPTADAQAMWTAPVLMQVRECKPHADTLVACAEAVADRSAAESLKGARVFLPRSAFPTPGEGEFYWVDLLGCQVFNRQGQDLGQVKDLMATGPQTVLVIDGQYEGKAVERMIPFVAAYVDEVDLPARRITVDWQVDY